MTVSRSRHRDRDRGRRGCGLAAACALAQDGYVVELLSKSPMLGDALPLTCIPASERSSITVSTSFLAAAPIFWTCCGARTPKIRSFGQTGSHFWSLAAVETVLKPAPLPAPLHSTPSFLTAKALKLRDKLAIARGIATFLKGSRPEDDRRNVADWLRSTGQTPRAVEHFWKPVLFSALNEDPDRISMRYAAKVFREAFLFSAEAGRMGVPRVPRARCMVESPQLSNAQAGRYGFEAQSTSCAVIRHPDDGGFDQASKLRTRWRGAGAIV